MPIPKFVIVESRATDEQGSSKTLAATLYGSLEYLGLSVSHVSVRNLPALQEYLAVGVAEDVSSHLGAHGHFPSPLVLHLTMHGSESGLELGNREFVPWAELRRMLVPARGATDGQILLCMSACEGFGITKQLPVSPREVLGVVGPTRPITRRESLVAFLTFYHLITCKPFDFETCVNTMQLAAGNHCFRYVGY